MAYAGGAAGPPMSGGPQSAAAGNGSGGVSVQTLPQGPATQSIALRYLRKHPLPPAFRELYAIEDELGAGGCGFCMSARRREDGKEVCAKFILKSRVSSQSWVRDDAYWLGGPTVNPGSNGGRYNGTPHTSNIVPLEVYLLRRIRHPGIVSYYDCFEDVRFFILVMELHGTSWERKVDLPSFSALTTDSLVTSVKSRDAHVFVDEESDDEDEDDDDDDDADSDSDIVVDDLSQDEDDEPDMDRMDVSTSSMGGAAAGPRGPSQHQQQQQSAGLAKSIASSSSNASSSVAGSSSSRPSMTATTEARNKSGSGGSSASDFGPANVIHGGAPPAPPHGPSDGSTKPGPLTPPPTPPVHQMEGSGDPAMIPSGASSSIGTSVTSRPIGPGRFFPSLNNQPNGPINSSLPPSSSATASMSASSAAAGAARTGSSGKQPQQQQPQQQPHPQQLQQHTMPGYQQQQSNQQPQSPTASGPSANRPPQPPPQPPRPAPSSLPPAPVTGVKKRASCDLFEAIEKLQYFTEPQARHIFRQIAEAVYYLQVRCGIVHRDIKDENVGSKVRGPKCWKYSSC